MIGGHVKVINHHAAFASSQLHICDTNGATQYAQGAISSALGYETGEKTKQEAVQEMKDASAQSSGAPAQNGPLGMVENKVGQLTGCEGMEKEGAQRIPQGSEAQSGTG